MVSVVVPQLGESVVEARVARWLKKPGEYVSAGEPVVELETEKIDLEVGAEHGGVLVEIARQEGADVKVGEVLGVIDGSAAAGAPEVAPRRQRPRGRARRARARRRPPTLGRRRRPRRWPSSTTSTWRRCRAPARVAA